MEKFIQPFIATCEKVFAEFCQTTVKSSGIFFASKDEYESRWDISGVIGMTGEAQGAIAISMRDATALKITKVLTGKDHKSIDDDVTDAIGEIVNIIAGNVKRDFEEDLRIKISLPSIIKGKAHSIVWPSSKTRIVCISFSIFEDQELCLSVAVDPAKERGA